MSIEVKTLPPFYSDHYSLCKPGENLLLDENKKKNRTKSLAEAKLEPFCRFYLSQV